MAAAPLLASGHFFSHVSAARLWGMRLPARLASEPAHISARMPDHAPRMMGIRAHRLARPAPEITLFDAVPVTTPPETWRQLSTLMSVDELIVVGDGILCRRQPLASSGEMLRALARHGGHRGSKNLRAAWREIRTGTDSARETLLRLLICRSGLPEPMVNHEARLGDGTSTPIDLAYVDRRIAVEYNGAVHLTPTQAARDAIRREQLAAAGWLVLEVVGLHLRSPEVVIDRIASALRARE